MDTWIHTYMYKRVHGYIGTWINGGIRAKHQLATDVLCQIYGAGVSKSIQPLLTTCLMLLLCFACVP
jgi:hypothetical protein